MLYVRRPGWLQWGMPCLLLTLTVNHAVALWRQHRASMRASSDLKLNVQMEDTVGHNTIGIDEASLPGSEEARFLHFSTLGLWDYQPGAPRKCPAPLQALNGKRFSSVGFMYPLQEGNYVKTFCLLRSTQTCCYGPRPQFNQYLLVETSSPVAFQRLTPVLVSGTFYVDPNPDEGYIYRMAADAVQVVDDETPRVDAPTAARQAHLPLFDYRLLTALHTDAPSRNRHDELRALAGKRVVVSGYCVGRTRAALPHLTVSYAWWDGIAQGEPPTPYNSLQVFPADVQNVPPLWEEYQTFTGVLRLIEDERDRTHVSGVQLLKAQAGVPGVTSPGTAGHGPPLPWQIECLLACGVLCGSLGWRRYAPEARIPFQRLRPLRGIRFLFAAGLAGLVYGLVLRIVQSDRNAALAAAVMSKDARQALQLLDQGADPNGLTAEPESGEADRPPIPLLQDATQRAENSAVVVKALLDRGARIDAKDSNGKTALMAAATLQSTDAARLLIERGAALESRASSVEFQPENFTC
jgi:hypothetical protein